MTGVLIAFGVPVIFMLCGAMGKKLVRGTSWERKDFYLGIQLTLATFSADILFVVELLRTPQGPATQATQAVIASATAPVTALLFNVLVFGIYLWLLTLHQDWENRVSPNEKGQFLRLVVLSNSVGTFLFATFVFLVKGIR